MKQISKKDTLFITVNYNGKNLLNVSLSGLTSMKEIMKYVHKSLNDYAGKLLTLQLRNSTQGWNRTDSMLLAA